MHCNDVEFDDGDDGNDYRVDDFDVGDHYYYQLRFMIVINDNGGERILVSGPRNYGKSIE